MAKPELIIASEKLRTSNQNKRVFIISSKLFKKRGINIVFFRKTLPCRVVRYYSISIDEQISSSVANQIEAFAIVYD